MNNGYTGPFGSANRRGEHAWVDWPATENPDVPDPGIPNGGCPRFFMLSEFGFAVAQHSGAGPSGLLKASP